MAKVVDEPLESFKIRYKYSYKSMNESNKALQLLGITKVDNNISQSVR